MKRKVILFWFFSIWLITPQSGQSFFVPSDTLNKTRLYTALGVTTAVSTTFAIGLYNAWYNKFETQPFHFFNDFGEWGHMDKAGHMHAAYFQGYLTFKGARWTGLNKRSSIWTGIICSTVLQGTLEVFDGYSAKWGFSLSDIAANVSGTSIFALQQYYWDEQKIILKVSSLPNTYSKFPVVSSDGLATTDLNSRANDLFGSGYFERYLKDYNALIYWSSFNIHSLLNTGNKWPKWLNIALGYSAENMFGGFENSWSKDNKLYTLNTHDFPRYSQFYISPDIDFTKIKTKNPFLKSIFTGLNVFKMPAPAIELNTRGQIVFHLLK